MTDEEYMTWSLQKAVFPLPLIIKLQNGAERAYSIKLWLKDLEMGIL